MKQLFFAAALWVAAATAMAADVAVSVSVGQPGFYGQIDIGGFPPPQVINRQPRMIRYVESHREPIYLNVPPRHSNNWGKYCGRYNACDRRVYFVQNSWYQREYAPRYQVRTEQRRHEQRGDHRRNDDDRYRDKDRDRDNDKGGDKGNRGRDGGKEKGNDNGHDKRR